jgi:hypothetical protein
MSSTRVLLLPVVLLGLLAAQSPRKPFPTPQTGQQNPPPPEGPSPDTLAKAAYRDSLDDARKLLALAEELKTDIEKNDRYVVSMDTIHKTEEIEKIAKRIRGRMKQQ